MKLLVIVETTGESFPLDLGGDMRVEDASALLEAETGIPTTNQVLQCNGKQLSDKSASLESCGIKEHDMLLLSSTQPPPVQSGSAPPPQQQQQQPSNQAGVPSESESEMIRLQLLGNAHLMSNLRNAFPEMATAAESNPAKFRELLPQLAQQQNEASRQRERNIALLNADPLDVDAQRQIEEAIQQEAVLENMSHAMEYSPESFGSVHMLYVQAEVNKMPIKAFVDSGAQATIMSPECAQQCGIMRLLDRRFAGIARGVGTAKILGRVHAADIKLGDDLFLGCSFTIMEGKGVDLLFGLDMLKRHQAILDLGQNALIIQGRKVRFLDEHELPKTGLLEDVEAESGSSQAQAPNPGAAMGAAAAENAQANAPPKDSNFKAFGGSGNTLGSSSSTTQRGASSSSAPAPSSGGGGGASQYPEESVQGLLALGVSRDEALRLLEAAGGNPDVAASLMFSG